MQYLFYDTCALLDQGKTVFENDKPPFYISTITLKELEYIKSSASKDQEIKYKARKLINLLAQHEDKYNTIFYENDWDDELKKYKILLENDDSRIILSALKLQQQKQDEVLFITTDYFCRRLAAAVGLKIDYLSETDAPYHGFITINTASDTNLAEVYNQIYSSSNENPFELIKNQYLS